MGLTIVVPGSGPCPLAPVLDALAAAGYPCVILMVDGALRPPRAAPPEEWRSVRLKTPQGMVTLERGAEGVSVVVFGNADAGLIEAQRRVAAALGAGA